MHRDYWLKTLESVAGPVLKTMAHRQLKRSMPVESKSDRSQFTHLEALGRTLCGIAPWLEAKTADEEEQQQSRFVQWAQQAIDAAVDPESPDHCQFSSKQPFTQSLVDAAFLAQAIVRAPRVLWAELPDKTKEHLRAALLSTRCIRPPYCNWLLFTGMIEAALYVMGEQADPVRMDYAIRKHEEWYHGDGMYGDGPEFHWDYYNSYVIQPMLIDIIRTAGSMYTESDDHGRHITDRIYTRAKRYAAIQEKLISPEGTFPVIGRSIAYRTGAFHLLAQMAWLEWLPDALSPGQVRCALQAVMDRCLTAKGNMDSEGWLNIGLCASQPDLGESYISTGSLYLCTTVFLPLGLSAQADFWSMPDQRWSSQKIWNGDNSEADGALKED